MTDSTSVARSELAPTGTLRVALNMSNFLLTATDPATGEPSGIAADLGRELGQRLGVPVVLLPYPNPGELADAAPTGVWDVGFIGAEPQRAHAIDFTAAYVEIEATYLVPPGSPLQTIADVDRPGIRIAAPARSAYELYLSRTLQHAQLVREQGAENAFARFVEGRFTAVQQAAGTPKGHPAGARYLCTFIEDIKATGLVARTIAKHNVRGLTVAPPA
jgi:polar amino acid transport system substrate-binding protein